MSKLRVLVTGAKGQLGIDLVKALESLEYEVWGCGKEELDITNILQVKDVLKTFQPQVVIHAAAYTKVDDAESEPELAFLVNGYGTRNIAFASAQIGAKLVYVSTDYVFDGKTSEPYHEFALPNPLNVYGKSKLAGEQFVKELHSQFFIVRTSWVYGMNGHNFVKTMLKLSREKKVISVVNDQIGSPTYTVDLASKICDLIQTEKYGTYHISNSGHCSWFEFAKAIFDEAHIQIEVHPCKTSDYPRPACRPAHSVLNHLAIRLNGFKEMRHWREALKDYFDQLRR